MLTSASEQSRPIDRAAPTSALDKENRRFQRFSLPLPMRIEVKFDSKTSWNEITRLSDVSPFGAGFTFKRLIKRGRMIMLTIPMPRQLRSFDYAEPQYKVWGLVRRCIPVGTNAQNPEYSIGVAFTGKSPPPDYLEHPSRLYDLAHPEDDGNSFWHLSDADTRADDSHLPNDQRRHTRYSIPETLTLEQIDDDGNVLMRETTVTENISLGGAAVFTLSKAATGIFLWVTSDRFDVKILSVVRNTRVGPDGITRLHLEFIDKLFPLEGIG